MKDEIQADYDFIKRSALSREPKELNWPLSLEFKETPEGLNVIVHTKDRASVFMATDDNNTNTVSVAAACIKLLLDANQ